MLFLGGAGQLVGQVNGFGRCCCVSGLHLRLLKKTGRNALFLGSRGSGQLHRAKKLSKLVIVQVMKHG